MPRLIADALEQTANLAAAIDLSHAENLHFEALALRSEHGLRPFCIDSLEAIATIAIRSESFTEAARLLAACTRARQNMSCPRRPISLINDGALHDQLRAALGRDAYVSACDEGRALNLDDALEYARRSRGTRGRPSTGWASLTPTEQAVVRLAVDGLTNPDIGSRLVMSRSTVKAHLSHVFAKLGVANRTELATMASPHLVKS